MTGSLDSYLDDPLVQGVIRLRQENEKARSVLKLVSGGKMESPVRREDVRPAYSPQLRYHAVRVVFEMWNEEVEEAGQGRDLRIDEIHPRLLEEVLRLKKAGAWEFGVPGELSRRRRIEESADRRFYEGGVPAVVCVDPPFYRPNPYYLSPETRRAVLEQVKAAEILERKT